MQLIINDYKNILGMKFNIHSNRLILVGENSVGKSNILDAIYNNEFKISNGIEYKDVIYVTSNDIPILENQLFLKLYKLLFNEEDPSVDEVYEKLKQYFDKDFYKHCNDKMCSVDIISGIGYGLNRKIIFSMIDKLLKTNVNDKYIILIDLPETFAHPSLIRSISSKIKKWSLNSLVVVTTHSPSVVEYVYDDIRQIVKISNVNDEIIPFQVDLDHYMSIIVQFYHRRNVFRLPNGKYNEALDYIVRKDLRSYCKSILRDKTFKILFSDILVIGEGESEEILFDYIFSQADNDIYNSSNIDYLTGYGKFYLPFYFILANLYNVKVICMFDADNLENKSHLAFYESFMEYELLNSKMFANLALIPDLESVLGVEMPRHRVEKPLHIYNTLYNFNSNINDISLKLSELLTNMV